MKNYRAINKQILLESQNAEQQLAGSAEKLADLSFELIELKKRQNELTSQNILMQQQVEKLQADNQNLQKQLQQHLAEEQNLKQDVENVEIGLIGDRNRIDYLNIQLEKPLALKQRLADVEDLLKQISEYGVNNLPVEHCEYEQELLGEQENIIGALLAEYR